MEVVDNILGNIAVEWEALAVLRGCGGRCTRARCQENTRNAAHAVVRELGGIGPDGGRAIAREHKVYECKMVTASPPRAGLGPLHGVQRGEKQVKNGL